jgi:geranylgeranyl diphosphate synthase type II
MIGGQVVDILGEGKEITAEELLYMHDKKTGELIRACILAGVILGGGSKEEEELLNTFGKKLGLAFQVKDDILDIIGDKNMLGKSTDSDKNNNKSNFISVYGLEKCNEICASLTEECINILNKLPRDTKKLKELTIFLLQRNF